VICSKTFLFVRTGFASVDRLWSFGRALNHDRKYSQGFDLGFMKRPFRPRFEPERLVLSVGNSSVIWFDSGPALRAYVRVGVLSPLS
jgi:hypothetical protein